MKACFQLCTDINGKHHRCCEPYGKEHYHELDDIKSYSVDELHDYVVAHGFGPPTRWAYRLAANLIAGGCDTAEAAAEIVSRNLTRQQ